MANQAAVRTGLPIFLQKKSASRVRSTLFDELVTFAFITSMTIASQKVASEGLGIPQQISSGPNASSTGIMISSLQTSKVQMAKIFNEWEYRPLIKTSTLNASVGKDLGDYDNLPGVPNWETNSLVQQFQQPVVHFARNSMPYSIPHTDIDTAVAGVNGVEAQAAAAFNVHDGTIKETQANLAKRINCQMFGLDYDLGTAVSTSAGNIGMPLDESQRTWSSIHSFKNAIGSATNLYCGIDRSLASGAYFRGAASSTVGTATSDSIKNLIRDTNITQGIAKKGGGIELVALSANQWLKALAEVEATRGPVVWTNEVPELSAVGSRRQAIRFDVGNKPTYAYYEPALPDGEAMFIDPKTWTFALHPKYKFKITGPIDLTETQDRPEERNVGTVIAAPMLVCEVPSFNRYLTSLS